MTYTVNPQISGAEDVYQLSGRSQEVNAVGGDFSPSYSVSFLTDQLPNSLVGGFARASNATMFNAAGQRVWAPANLLANSSISGAVAGVLGSGGALPTGWSWLNVATLSREVVAIGVDYVDVRLSGTNTTGTVTYPHLYFQAALTQTAGIPLTGSVYATLLAGDFVTGFAGSPVGKISIQYLNGGTYLGESSPSVITAAAETRLVTSGVVAGASVNGVRMIMNLIVAIGATVDVTFRLRTPQLEITGVDSPKAFVNSTGSQYYGPRFDYNPSTLAPRGFLIEGQAVNTIKNSEMVGASVGVHPTGWTAGNSNAVATSVTGTGIEDGMPYVDVRWSGTASAAGTTNLEFNASGATDALQNELWCGSFYIRKLSGTDPTGSKILQLIEGNPGYLGSPGSATLTGWNVASLRLYRPYAAATTLNAGTTKIRMVLAMAYALSEVVDITVRIGCPQLEGGATTPSCYAPSSPIPTYGIVATRGVDACSTAFTTWNPTEGTVFADFETNMANATAFVPALAFSDGTTANRTHMSTVITPTTIGGIMHSVVAGVTEVNLNATPVAGARCKSAYRYRLNDWAICSNGGAIAPDTLAGVLPSVTTLALGVSSTVNTPTMWRWLRKVSYYPRGLTNTELQAITS